MELASKEPGVIRQFNDFDEAAIPGLARQRQPICRQNLFVLGVEFIAVPVTLAYLGLAKDLLSQRAFFQQAFVRAQPHCAPHFFYSNQIAELEDNRVRSIAVEFCRVRPLEPAHIPRELYAGALHAQAYPEEWSV